MEPIDISGLKRFDIQELKPGQEYFPFQGGEYVNDKGEKCLLSVVQGRTLWRMLGCDSLADEFELFCYAYVWRLRDLPRFYFDFPKALEQFHAWQEKFGQPWNWNARHTLPSIESWADRKVLTADGLDFKLLKQKFEEYRKYKYVVYP
jgi:hypothetical protein